MIKLLFVQSTIEKGGITNHLKTIIQFINKQEFDVEVLCLSDENKNSDWKSIESMGVTIHQLHSMRWYSNAKIVKLLNKSLLEIQPDIIQTFTYRPSFLIGNYFADKYKTVGVLSSNVFQNYTDTYGTFIGNYIAKKELNGLSKMNRVVAVAKHLVTEFATSFSIQAIQNGIDIQMPIEISEQEKLKYRLKLNWLANTIYIVSVGTLSKRKNPQFLIDSFLHSKLKKQAKLVLIGTGKLHSELEKKYKLEPSIVFAGQQNNVSDWLKAADVFVSASVSEGLPLSVLEAMSYQLPCLLSQIPAHQELHQELQNKKGIQLFSLNNPIQLIQLMDSFSPFQAIYTVQTASQMTLSYEFLYHELYLNHEPA